MENQTEKKKKMEKEMEARRIQGFIGGKKPA